MAPKKGERYLKVTAVPTGKYFKDMKNNDMDMNPTKLRSSSNFLLFQNSGSL